MIVDLSLERLSLCWAMAFLMSWFDTCSVTTSHGKTIRGRRHRVSLGLCRSLTQKNCARLIYHLPPCHGIRFVCNDAPVAVSRQ